MRVALISTHGQFENGETALVRPLAGRSLALRQVDLAIALGCERIACLAEAPSPEIVRMQHTAQKAGARFNAITGPRPLSGIVRAEDEILVLAPGVLVDPQLARDALGGRPGILTLGAETGVAAGFERIDRGAAWAGVMLAPGSAVDRLADMPSDSDPVSSLLRIAAQMGLRQILLAPAALDNGGLALVSDHEAHARAEQAWLRRGVTKGAWRRPLTAAVGFATRMLAPRLLAYHRAAPAARAIGSAFAIGAAAFAWYERPAIALATLAIAAAFFVAGRQLAGLERGTPAGRAWRADLALDVLFVAIAFADAPRNPQSALFAALVLMASVRLSAVQGPASPLATAGDRVLLFGLAASAAAADTLVPAMQIAALVILGFDLFERTRSRLTGA